MSSAADKKSGESSTAADKGRPGRVEVDARGRNVWRWNAGENDSTSMLLKRLDNDALALEPTQKVQKLKKLDEPPATPGKLPAKGAAPGKPGGVPVKPSAKPVTKPQTGLGLSVERDGRDQVGGFDPYNSR